MATARAHHRSGNHREPSPRGAHLPAAAAFKEAAFPNDLASTTGPRPSEGFRDFWAEESKRIDWIEPWTELLDWQLPYAKWFVGGKLNISVNCLDRHVANGLGDKVAYYWEGEPGETRTLTYRDLLRRDLPDGERPPLAGREEGRQGRRSTCR